MIGDGPSGVEFWDRVYRGRPFEGGEEPNPFLVDMLPRLQKGKVLDIAMGEGQNSVFLAERGFQVRGFDLSEVAVTHATDLARRKKVSLEANRADLDLHLMGLMEYETLIMTYFKPQVPRYYSEMIRALKQGGTLLVESFMNDELREPLGKGEAYRDFYFAPNELLRHLSKDLRILFYHEGRVDGRSVVQCLAQKPMDKDAARYRLFDMQVKEGDRGRSHAVELAESFFKKSQD